MNLLMQVKQYVPGTDAYDIRKGLSFVDTIRKDQEGRKFDTTLRGEAYEAFTKKIQECQQHGCQESVYELSCMADKVSPALGHVSSVWKMLEAVKRTY